MTVDAIKDAISNLSDKERDALATWMDKLKEEQWDREIERDFAPGGPGAAILADVERKIAAGQFEPMSDGCRRRKKTPRNR